MMPRSVPPIISETITVTALTPTCRDMIFGTQHVVLELLLRDEEQRHPQRRLIGRHRERHGNRRNARPGAARPSGSASPMPAISART